MSAAPASLNFAFTLLLTAAVFLLVAGCGNKDPETAIVVVKVDDAEISLRQLNTALAKAKDISPENISHAKLEILNALVNEQLAVNLAMHEKLDQKPEVIGAIQASRNQILARVAMDKILADIPKVSEEDANKYYADHPALFSERRIFTVQEISLARSTAGMNKIRAQVTAAKRMEDIATWLKDNDVEFTMGTSTLPAEQVASEVLPQLLAFREGQIGLFESRDTYTITRLVASRVQAIPSAKAFADIMTMLSNQRAAKAIQQANLDLKAKAKLEYFGEFVGGEAAFKARIEADRKSAMSGDDLNDARAKAEATIVEQGIKGL